MRKQTVTKDDGRLLVYYWFDKKPSALRQAQDGSASRQRPAKQPSARNPKSLPLSDGIPSVGGKIQNPK